MATFIPLVGWTGDDAEEAKAATSSRETASAIGQAGPVGGVAFGADRFTPATDGQYGQAVNGIIPDPRFPQGSPEWLAYYAPEYLDAQGNPYRVDRVGVTYGGGPGQVTIRGTTQSGLRNPWETIEPGMDEETIRKWMDSQNYFRNGGQSIDPRVLQGMQEENPFTPKGDPRIASNQYGRLTLGSGPSDRNPYGLNASYEGSGFDGQPYNYAGQYWGYVQQTPRGQVYVPGWNTTALMVGHPSHSVPSLGAGSPYYDPGDPSMPWTNFPVGTNITGWFGDLTPDRRAALSGSRVNRRSSNNSGGSGSSGGSSQVRTGWRQLENGNWLHIASGNVYDREGKLVSGGGSGG